jgi:surfeit locus 1 family protein
MSARVYRFLRSPRWITGHVVALVTVVVFINLGLWQLRRLDERRAFNELIVGRSTAEEHTLGELLNEYGADEDSLELRAVDAHGEYVPDEEVILLARSYEGISGHHVLTPLRTDDGLVVIVDRGWVPIDLDMPGAPEFSPPVGRVTVHGVLRKGEVRGPFAPSIPTEGRLDQIARIDIERLDQQIGGEVVPVYIQLTAQDPAQIGELPIPVPLPTPSEGPHLGYAVQWFLFTAVVLVGYPILLRRTAENDATETPGSG